MRILPAVLLLTSALYAVAFVPSAGASCVDSNPFNDDGVGFSCTIPGTGIKCTGGALAYGDPTPSASCKPQPIQCIREPCP